MGWYGYFHGTPQSACDVAAAFFAGKTKKRTNCETDGERYFLLNTLIARRLDLPKAVARKIEGEERDPREYIYEGGPQFIDDGEPRFSYGGYGTKTTARHLCALGVDAEIIDREPCFNGVPVDHREWFTKAEIAALVKVPMPPKAPRGKFVNLTMELFPA